jgi:hypothetical protein
VCGRVDELEFVELGFVEVGFVELGFVVPGVVELGLFGFGFVEVGLGELFAGSRVFNRFAASPTNSPLGYFFKYSLKSSGFVLSLIEFQKIISAAVALSLDFAGRLVFEFFAGALFVVVVFLGVGVGFAMTSPPLPCGVPAEAFGFNEGIIRSSTAASELRRVTRRILNLKQSVFIAGLTLLPITCY